MNPTYVSLRKICFITLGLGIGLLVLMLFLPNAATTVWQIRWYPIHLSSLICISIGACGFLIGKDKKNTGSVFLTGGCLGLIAMGLVSGALNGPFPSRALIYSFAALTALFCATVLLVSLHTEELRRMLSSRLFQLTVAVFLILWCGLSLYGFLTGELFPLFSMARRLDVAANGGLYDLILEQKLPEIRNAGPMGHANYNSGFLLLILPLLLHGIRQPATRMVRILSVFALSLGVLMLLSTQSRNAWLGMVVAVGICFWWKRPTVKRLLPVLGGSLLLFLIFIALIPRFRIDMLSVSPARWGMWKAAWWTGWKYFPFGSGEGLTPEMLQLFSPSLDSVWENSIQFHHTWLHVWAAGGGMALFGLLGITLWCVWKVLRPWKCDPQVKPLVIPSVMALAATFVVFWADYQLDIFPMGILLFLHLVIFVVSTEKPSPSSLRYEKWTKLLWIIPAGCMGISAVMIPASVHSRRKIDAAGAAYETGNAPLAVSRYLEALDAVPEPYSLNMAGVILSAAHSGHADAIALFDRSLTLWEPQTLVHEYLVSLWMHEAEEEKDPVIQKEALEKALHHARRRAEIAPQLKGGYLDLAQISHQLSLPEEEITEALFNELLMQGDLLFPGTWTVLDELQPYREPVLRKLMTVSTPSESRVHARIELLQGYLHLLEEVPEGLEVPDNVHERMNRHMEVSTKLHLLREVCEAEPPQKQDAMKRLLVYLFETPVSDEAVTLLLPGTSNCMGELLNFGKPRRMPSGFKSVGISARHPFSIRVNRPHRYPDVFGSRFISSFPHKPFIVEEE